MTVTGLALRPACRNEHSGADFGGVGVGHFKVVFRKSFISDAAEDDLGNKIRRPPRCFTKRDAQTEKIFGVYETPPSLLCGCQTKLQELVAVLVQHKHAIELGIESITQERIV